MNDETSVSNFKFSFIILATLVAFAFLSTLALLVLAISILLEPSFSFTSFSLVVVCIFTIISLVMVFSLATAISCICAPLASERHATLYSLGSWASIALVVAALAILSTAAVGVHFNVKPKIITDVNILKAYAVTTITLDSREEEAEKNIKTNNAMSAIAWTSFLSVSLGLAASLCTGKFLYRHRTNLRK